VASYASPPNFYPSVTVFVDGLFQLKTSSFTYAPPSGYSAWG
jgi:hypothetical protein